MSKDYIAPTFILLLAILISGCAFNGEKKSTKNVEVELGVNTDGSITPLWKAAILERHQSKNFKILSTKKPLADTQDRWFTVVKEVIPAFTSTIESLRKPFGEIDYPSKIKILAGNQGGEDGFTFGEDIICLDLNAWVKAYGQASDKESNARVLRILSHEYTHLLTKAWAKKNKPILTSSFDRSLWELFYEGLGNFRSMSDKWKPIEGKLSPTAEKALRENIPIFVKRIAKLARTKNLG